MHKLHCYVVVAPQATVVIPDEVQLHVIMCKECHKRVHTLLADLQMYHMTWKQGAGAYQIQLQWIDYEAQ